MSRGLFTVLVMPSVNRVMSGSPSSSRHLGLIVYTNLKAESSELLFEYESGIRLRPASGSFEVLEVMMGNGRCDSGASTHLDEERCTS